MQNNVFLLTGANSGIGRVTARTLAEQGATLIMICRNKQRGEQTLEEIRSRSKNNDIHLFVGDLSSQAEIRRLAIEIIPRFPRIDVLLNNAGGINSERTLTIDGLETTFAVNHLAYFLLTNLLLPSLLNAPAPRIVNVSSQAHQIGRINFDDLGHEKSYNAMKAYAQSKLANILFTYELARRLSSEKITANTLHPGTVNTGFGKQLRGIVGVFFRSFTFLMRSPEKGAETLIWLATAPEVNGVSGKYFCDMKVIRSSTISHDANIAKQLWDVSARLTGIVEGQST
jgi:NAD(P)-dependent dehydrogenase (short-subunit alcohol dehydrogenase family)